VSLDTPFCEFRNTILFIISNNVSFSIVYFFAIPTILKMEILQTRRLTLSEATLSDIPLIFKLLNSPNWLEFIGDRNIRTLEDAEKYIQNSLIKSYRENGFGLWKVELKSDKTPIGLCGLLKREMLDFPDLGFAILPNHAGVGYISEVAKATVSYAKSNLELKQILAITSLSNYGSQAVLKKTGFTKTGEIEFNGGKGELYELNF
jgi:ribosomal-protein-alanine N-acetyltransferase